MTATDPLVQAALGVTVTHTIVGFGDDVRCSCGAWRYGLDDHLFDEHRARATVAVLVPLIRAEVAAELNAAADEHNRNIAAMAGVPYDPDRHDGMVANGIRRAARIAEEGTDRG